MVTTDDVGVSHTNVVLHRACTLSVIIRLPVAPFQNGGLSNSLLRNGVYFANCKKNQFLFDTTAGAFEEETIVRR